MLRQPSEPFGGGLLLLAGRPLAVQQGQLGHEFDLVLGEAQQFRIADEVVAVLGMLGIGDEDADVMQDGRMAEQFPRLFVRADAAALRGGIIQLQGKAHHVPAWRSS